MLISLCGCQGSGIWARASSTLRMCMLQFKGLRLWITRAAEPASRDTGRMSQATTLITERVRERVRRDGVDLHAVGVAERYVRDEVQRYSERALGGSMPLLVDESRATSEVIATLTGFGPLQPYFDDAEVEEIWINAPDKIFIAREGIPELTGLQLTDADVRDLVERMLQSTGRRVDLSTPFVDASLPDGSRLHVVIPDVTRQNWAVNI